ncbi:MAG: glycosyltransferase [Colwellia sp.]
MVIAKKSLLVITNLYPVLWGPNRASFNKQQFDLINKKLPVNIIVLLPWWEWLSHKGERPPSSNIKYCPYFYIPKFGRRLVPFFQFISLLFLIPWIKNNNPKALMASWGFPDAVAASMLNNLLKLPFFVKVHGTDVNENTQFPPRTRLMKKWLNKAETIFCPSKALVQTLSEKGVEQEKLCVNYNGVNPDIFYPAQVMLSLQKFIFVGSLIATKGCNELISAFIQAKDKFPNIELDIVGEGPMKYSLLKIINQHNLSADIRIHGSVPLPEVAEFIRQANVLVLPSYREGVPNVLLESFASGTPVIATRVGGIPEIVNENVGLLVDAKDINQLANAMEKSLNTTWSNELITEHANQFNWQKNVNVVLNKLGE